MASSPALRPSSKPSTSPIALLATPLSQTFTHIHPLLILSTLYLAFPSLVAAPVSSMLYLLFPISALQLLYLLICLPPSAAGSSTSTKRPQKSSSSSSKAPPAIAARIIPALLSLTLTLLTAPPILFVFAVLLGAPLTTHFAHTFLLATHVAVLTILPLSYVLGVQGRRWVEVLSLVAPVDECVGGLVGGLVGGWAGAVPIPLDWDREWQRWPLTILTGAYLGYVVGKVLGGSVFKGKTISFD